MDGFKDKSAKKFNAQEVIRANMAADAAQMDRLEKQVSEYDGYMREMRKLSLKGIENEQKLRGILKEGEDYLKTALEDYEQQMQNVTEQCIKKIHQLYLERDTDDREEEAALMEGVRRLTSDNMKEMRELFQKSDEHTHRENVKVYRNVQAVIAEELGEQKELTAGLQAAVKKNTKRLILLNLLVLLVGGANLGLWIAHLSGAF